MQDRGKLRERTAEVKSILGKKKLYVQDLREEIAWYLQGIERSPDV